MGAVAATALLAASAGADDKSWYVSMNLGYASNTAKLESGNTNATEVLGDFKVTHTLKDKKDSALAGALTVGSSWDLGHDWGMGFNMHLGYNDGKVKLSETTVQHTPWDTTSAQKGTVTFKPGLNLGAGVFFGRHMADRLSAYMGLSGELSLAHVHFKHTATFENGADTEIFTRNDKESVLLVNAVPHLGLTYAINEKWHAVLDLGYKFPLWGSYYSADKNLRFKKRPEAFVASLGFAYSL